MCKGEARIRARVDADGNDCHVLRTAMIFWHDCMTKMQDDPSRVLKAKSGGWEVALCPPVFDADKGIVLMARK